MEQDMRPAQAIAVILVTMFFIGVSSTKILLIRFLLTRGCPSDKSKYARADLIKPKKLTKFNLKFVKYDKLQLCEK